MLFYSLDDKIQQKVAEEKQKICKKQQKRSIRSTRSKKSSIRIMKLRMELFSEN